MVGSSWNRPEVSGLAPMRSPAETNSVLGLVAVAQGASAADFRLVNRTNQAILTFQVEAQHQQDRYSGNWLSQPLLPGGGGPSRYQAA